MVILNLTYKKPTAEVDVFQAEHRAFLAKKYSEGVVIVSGRKSSNDGGIIVTSLKTKAEAETFMREDPYHREDLADYTFIEVTPTKYDPKLRPQNVPW